MAGFLPMAMETLRGFPSVIMGDLDPGGRWGDLLGWGDLLVMVRNNFFVR